ncbi:hypothetical protein E0Z10_g2772 [Xylaria hypoxylon]|uniref:EthD domain-containing protein n=1 Tax=Xylaria hypoxylon TaxID=37992 RepID=A0A4Z0YNS4_9PEZI|nr:hypothetical protein E0Z10_g2772 [Xylaria hypoxylon]
MGYSVIVFAYRKPGTTPEQFKAHSEGSHVPLIREIAGPTFPLSHTRRYLHRTEKQTSTNTVSNANTPATVLIGSQAEFDYDSFAELTFEDESACQAFFGVMQQPGNAARIAADEEKFLDRARLTAVVLGDTTETRRNTLNTIDPTEHARRRKVLNTCFTDNSVMLDQHDSTTEWSAYMELGENLDYLVFDIMGDLSFGSSFNMKDPGVNPLKAQNSTTGRPAYTGDELRAEATLLIIAGSDTTTASLASIFWYLSRDPSRYKKLMHELQQTFEMAEDVISGPKLMGYTYLRASIDEGMRLVPPEPCEPPREVLSSSLNTMNDHYPKGTIVGTVP